MIIGLFWLGLSLASAPAMADPAAERQLAERVVNGWPDPDSSTGMSPAVRSFFAQTFGDRMTPYAWQEAERAYTPRVIPWAEIRPFVLDAFVAEFTESELNELVDAVSSTSFQNFMPHIDEFRTQRSEAERQGFLAAHLTAEEIESLASYYPLLVRGLNRSVRAVMDVGTRFSHRYRSRIMSRCPNRTQPLPWCEN